MFAAGGGTITKTMSIDNRGHIQTIYRYFVEDFNAAKVESLAPHWCIDHAIDLEPSYNLPYGQSWNSLGWIEQSQQQGSIPAMLYNKIPCSRAGWWISIWTKDSIPYEWVDECVGSYDGQYVTGWIMGQPHRVNGRGTFWRTVTITFRELTELQEKSRTTAHLCRIMHNVERNGWNQRHHSITWIMARGGSQPENNKSQSEIVAGDGWQVFDPIQRSSLVWDLSRLYTDGWREVDDQRWIAGDWSWETNADQCHFV